MVLEVPKPKQKEIYFLDTKDFKPGAYLLDLQVKDAAGNAAAQQQHPLAVDLTPPTLTIIDPLVGDTVKSDSIINSVENDGVYAITGTSSG